MLYIKLVMRLLPGIRLLVNLFIEKQISQQALLRKFIDLPILMLPLVVLYIIVCAGTTIMYTIGT